MLQLYRLLQGCQLSVCTQGFWSFRPLALMLCRPDSLPRSPPFSSCVVSWTCILYSSGLLPWLSFLYTSTLFAGRASLAGVVVETWEYLLFKGLVPYAVLVPGGSKGVCFWRWWEMPGWHSVTDRESFKIPQSTSPPLFVPVQEGTGKITQEQCCVCALECAWVCVCVSSLGICSMCGIVMHMRSLHDLAHVCWVFAVVCCTCLCVYL